MLNRAMTAAAMLLVLAACASHHAANKPSSSAAASSSDMAGSGTSSAGISESQAKNMLEQDGYAGVKNLRQTGDGGWTGNATANGQPVTVTITSTGSVRAQ
jgi:protein-disulfide isomerase